MFTKIKIEQNPDCYTFQCTSEVVLKTDVIKIERDKDNEYEDSVESTEMKSELENAESGMSCDIFIKLKPRYRSSIF